MGGSEYGGAPTEVGVQSLIGGQNTQTNMNANTFHLRPPAPAPPQKAGKRRSEYGRDSSNASAKAEPGLPPRERPSIQR